MERRRVIAVLVGLVLVGGTVGLLRVAGGTSTAADSTTPPPLPTSLRPYAAPGVLPPTPGDKPRPPTPLVVTPGPHRLQLTWTAPAGAAGYEVRWGQGNLSQERLVAEPAAELDGLTNDQDARVQISTVDAFGQRSTPVSATGRPHAETVGPGYTLVERFDGPVVPDPRLWRLASPQSCAQATAGTGTDAGRLLVTGECGTSSVALRSRTPLQLRVAPADGELGRFTIDTDAPGEQGTLNLDLVPGPADLIDDGPSGLPLPASPNAAADDPSLPPGTIRVRITAGTNSSGSGQPVTTVTVFAAPGTPHVPIATTMPVALPLPRTGLSVRWDVVLTTDGIRVLRNGIYVGGGNVVPQWSEATALVGLIGPSNGQLHAGIALIAFAGAPATAPPLVPAPNVQAQLIVQPSTVSTDVASAGPPISGVTGGQLRLTLDGTTGTSTASLTPGGVTPTFQVEVNGRRFPAVPALPGLVLQRQVRYPLVAMLPASVLTTNGGVLPVRVLLTAGSVPAGYSGQLAVVQADLELTPMPGRPLPPATVQAAPPENQLTHLALLSAQLLDAGGQQLPIGKPVPQGRLLLAVSMDGPAGQRLSGRIGGLAGFQVWLDGVEQTAVPTAEEGPGIAGTWLIAFTTSGVTPGSHTIEIRALSTERSVPYSEAYVSFEVHG
jgi:hypothetical protein